MMQKSLYAETLQISDHTSRIRLSFEIVKFLHLYWGLRN